MARLQMVPEFSDRMAKLSVGRSGDPNRGFVPLEDGECRDGRSIHHNDGGHDDQMEL